MRTLVLSLVLLAGCGDKPTPTGTTCADPDPLTGTTTLTWDNFGHDFMFKYCTNCHASTLTHSHRNGATIYHDFDSLYGVLEVINSDPDHIDEQSGWGPNAHNNFMPGAGTNGRCPSVAGGSLDENCPEPTGEERTSLAIWVACERLRPHDLVDAGVDSGP
jgi:hypothetical protein